WALSAIPLGGYVKMMDEAPEGASPELANQAVNNKSLGQRSAIVLAGPMANLILAALLYTMLNLVGTSEPAAILAQPAAETVAAQAGIQAGDRITAVNGQPVQSWSEARWQLLDVVTAGGEASLQVDSDGTSRQRVLRFGPGAVEPDGPDPMAQAGLALAAP